MNNQEILQMLPKYTQALHTDAILYFSGEITLATEERLELLKKDIAMVRNTLDMLEKKL